MSSIEEDARGVFAENLRFAPGCAIRWAVYRRTLLAALAATSLATVSRRVCAQTAPRLKSIARDARGTTLWLGLDHAPFPGPGAGYRDDTVIVFVPAHYRFIEDEGVATLVHFHGHNTTAEKALVAHELREQLAESKQNAVLIVPQLATMAADSSCGKLEAPGGLERLLEETVATAAREGRYSFGDTEFPAD